MQSHRGILKEKAQAFAGSLDARGRAHNSGIDLLRLVSMCFVVALHMIHADWIGSQALQGGTTASVSACLFVLTFSYCAVDIFALISGYVAYSDEKKPIRLASCMQLWLQVVFYGLLVPAVCLLVRPQLVTYKDFLFPLFPITGEMYWYFTAYTGLFFLMPLLNEALRRTNRHTLRLVLIAILALFCVYETFLPRFRLLKGYSLVWLILLYYVGGILKKCGVGERLKPWAALSGAVALSLFGWVWRAYGPTFSLRVLDVNRESFLCYTSPTVLGAAILYLLAFSKLRFGRRMTRLIAYASPCAFAVYLLDTHPIVYGRVMDHAFAYLQTSAPPVVLGTVLAFSAGVLLTAVLTDRLRMRLFALLRIPSLLARIERTVRRLLDRVVPSD